MAKIGKRMKKLVATVDRNKLYKPEEAIDLVKKNAVAKFPETIDVAVNLGIDPKQSDQLVRGMAQLPHGTGKNIKVAVFAKGEKVKEAQAAGADLVGGDDLAEKILAGEMGFDRCIATPDMMGVVGKLGKVLGPKGLMPNPKLGTVTMNVGEAVKAAKAGAVEFRVEKAGILQAGIGKANFTEKQLVENFQAFMNAVVRARPSGIKGVYIQKITVSSTMGPGVKVDMTGLTGAGQASV